MEESMVSKGASLSPEGHKALAAEAEARGVSLADVVRDLLTQYVDGKLTLEDQHSGSQSRFCVPPDLLRRAEEKGASQGLRYGLLVGRLVDKALLQKKP